MPPPSILSVIKTVMKIVKKTRSTAVQLQVNQDKDSLSEGASF